MIIYKITNTVNGMCYVGQTIQKLNKRKGNHKSDLRRNRSNTTLYNAMRKYGWDSFIWETICSCSSIKELNEKEIYYIKRI